MKGSGGATHWPWWHVAGGAIAFGTVLTLAIAGLDAADIKGRSVALAYLALALFAAVGGTLATRGLWFGRGRPRWRVLIPLMLIQLAVFAGLASYVAKRAETQVNLFADLKVDGITAHPPGDTREVLDVVFRLRNVGHAPATHFRRVTAVSERVREATIEEIDELFDELHHRVSAIPPASTNEIRPGEAVEINLVGWQGRNGHPDAAAWQRQALGKSRIYTAALYQYRDGALSPGRWISVESCLVWFESQARVCPAHNRSLRP